MAMPQRQKYKIQKYTKIQDTLWTKYELKFFTDAAWEIRQLIAYNYFSNAIITQRSYKNGTQCAFVGCII